MSFKQRVTVSLVFAAIGGLATAGWLARAEPPKDDKAPAAAEAQLAAPRPRVDELGDPLPPAALRRFGTGRFHSGQFTTAAVYFPDGKTLATTSMYVGGNGVTGYGRVACLWDMATGQPRHRLPASDSAAFWDLASGKQMRAIRHAEELIERLRSKLAGAEEIRRVRAVEVLERIGTPEARGELEKLAAGAPEDPLTEECRATLARLERKSRSWP